MNSTNSEKFVKTLTGRVAYFSQTYGFITPDDSTISDVFVHHSSIEPWRIGFKELNKGDIVKFDLFETPRGLQAKNVEVKRDPVSLTQFKTAPDNIGNMK